MQIQLGEECVWRCSGMCSRVEDRTEIEGKFLNTEMCRGRMSWENGKKELVGQKDKKRGSEPKHAKDFVMSTVCSCRDGIPGRWRTQLDLSSRKSFDDQHRPTTLGASPKIAGTGGGDLLLGLRC
jgi:hypothetical protein